MNNARIWCVVRPTVGLPLFFGGAAVASLAVHASVLTNVNWFGQFFNGETMTSAELLVPTGDGRNAQAVVHFNGEVVNGKQMGIVELEDGRLAKVTFEPVASGNTEMAAVKPAQ